MAVHPVFLQTRPVVSKEDLCYAFSLLSLFIPQQFLFRASFLGRSVCRTLLLLEGCDFRNLRQASLTEMDWAHFLWERGADFLSGSQKKSLVWHVVMMGGCCTAQSPALSLSLSPVGMTSPSKVEGIILECGFLPAECHFSLVSMFSFTFSKDQRSGLFYLQDDKNKAAINITKHVVIPVQ